MADLASAELGMAPEGERTPAALVQALFEPLAAALGAQGFTEVQPTGRADALLLTARRRNRPVVFCFPPVAEHALALEAAPEEALMQARRLYPEHEVSYAALLCSEGRVDLLGPALVAEAESLKPLRLRRRHERVAPVLGAAADFKAERVLKPFFRSAGRELRFTIGHLLDGETTPEPGCRCLGVFEAPALLLAESPAESRLLFYDDGLPTAEAELVVENGADIELSDTAGHAFWAECAETFLYRSQLPLHTPIRWTLSLTAEKAEPLPLSLRVQPEGAADDVAAEVGSMELFFQPGQGTYTLLGGRVLAAEAVTVATRPMTRLRMQLPRQGCGLNVYVGAETEVPAVGDEVLVRGYLYAAPDSVLEGPLSEAQAAHLMALTLASRDWEGMEPYLAADFAFRSALRRTEIRGVGAFLAYMKECTEEWAAMTALDGVTFETGTLLHAGQRRACCMTSYRGRRDSAVVFRCREGRITSAETLPLDDYESFEPTEIARPEGVFLPYVSPMSPHPAALTRLQRFALQRLNTLLRERLGVSAHYGDGLGRWVQVLRDEPSFCDMAFQYGPNVYAVNAEQDPAEADRTAQLLAAAERYQLVPCLFSVTPGEPLPEGWNLTDARTGAPVVPETQPAPEGEPVFAWDAFLEAVQVVAKAIEEQGGHVLTTHNTPDVLPHLWFRDAEGRLSRCTVRVHWAAAPADRPATEEERRVAQALSVYPGYVADVGFTATDGVSRPRRGERHLYYLSPMRREEEGDI